MTTYIRERVKTRIRTINITLMLSCTRTSTTSLSFLFSLFLAGYMGFFDFDEFLVMQEPRLHSLLSRLPAGGVSPIMSLLWSHGFPLALSFMNR